MNKKIYILAAFLFCFLSFYSNAQNSEPIVDSSYIEESDTLIENSGVVADTVESENKKLHFNNAADDTLAIDTRFSLNDSFIKYKLDENFNYPPDEEKLKLMRERHKPTPVTKKETAKDDSHNIDTSFLNVILWTIIIVFMIVVIVLYVKDNNINMFSKKAKEVVAVEEIDYSDIFKINYNKQIESAYNTQDYNVAARLGFLRLLTLLNQKSIINYSIEKTNFDYQFQLMNTKYYNSFNGSAICYEYAWYSGIKVTSTQYEKIVKQYKELEDLL